MDKVHVRGYQRMGIVVGGLGLLTLTVIGSIGAIDYLTSHDEGRSPTAIESLAITVWLILAGFMVWFIVRFVKRWIHNWARLMGER